MSLYNRGTDTRDMFCKHFATYANESSESINWWIRLVDFVTLVSLAGGLYLYTFINADRRAHSRET